MRVEPSISLVFNGECDAAFSLYQQCLGGVVTFRLTWGDSPMAAQAPAVPLQKTFWAQRFGSVVDRFGIPWGINCGEREVV
jgi:uncharacterized glyoxalase superfamily protein PhnB